MQVVYLSALPHGDALAAKHIILRDCRRVIGSTQFFLFIVHPVFGPDAEGVGVACRASVGDQVLAVGWAAGADLDGVTLQARVGFGDFQIRLVYIQKKNYTPVFAGRALILTLV